MISVYGKPITLSRSQDEALATIASDLQLIIRTFQPEVMQEVPIDQLDQVSIGELDIELVINHTFDSYTAEDQARLLSAIRELLKVSSNIRVISKNRGSVKL